MTAFTRSDRSLVAEWWWTVDRWALLAVFVLVVSGLLMSLAASPAIAEKLGYADFHFVVRQAVFASAGFCLVVAASLLSPVGVRRLGIALFVAGVIGIALTLFVGPSVNGATRWLDLGVAKLQPSEFAKPGFVVVIALLLSVTETQMAGFARGLALLTLGTVIGLLALQPDFGQAALLAAVWLTLYFVSGAPLWHLGILGGIGAGLSAAAYAVVPHVRQRIDSLLDPANADTYQTDKAMEAVMNGGALGRGPGEGIAKQALPDAHTDFIFAVAAEEFGLIVCLLLVGLFFMVVVRSLSRVRDEADPFVQLCAAGLVAIFGLQALINMGVNVNLLPAKGMTLPFISYGGSSSLSTGLTLGMVLALTRRRAGGAWGAFR